MKPQQIDPLLTPIYDIAEKASHAGVAHLADQGSTYNGREVIIDNKKYINFASCSYLGLSLDQRLIDGTIDGVKRFGTSFPTSRSFLTLGYLNELEEQLEKIVGYSCIATTSTSLAHTAFLPIFISKKDVIICDHQVHSSVQVAAEIVRAKGCKRDVIRHNDLQRLEEKIVSYGKTNRHVWYLADGIYSMYGDTSPVKELTKLLQKYDHFHVYIDDAHGMSWTGTNGCGYVLSQVTLHPRMVLSTSLGKAFGSIGGVLICNNPDLKKTIKACGNAFIFSSPLPPSVIGASIASSNIHLSPEIDSLQKQLLNRINAFKEQALQLGLPLLGKGQTPIFFIPSGNPDTCFAIVQKMMQHGFYQSSAVFPSVPYPCGGVRFTITNWLTIDDINDMLHLLQMERNAVLKETGLTESLIKRNFKGINYTLNELAVEV